VKKPTRREPDILVIDDEIAFMRDQVKLLGRMTGASVRMAASLSQGIAEVEDGAPDVVLLDLVFFTTDEGPVSYTEYLQAVEKNPDADAFAFHRWLRSRSETTRAHVIFWSGRMFMRAVMSALHDGRTFYVAKSADLSVVAEWVRRALEETDDLPQGYSVSEPPLGPNVSKRSKPGRR
jgi:CheY-like chemotaxis protein